MTDIRYSFLNTLDFLPCDVVRTLWLLQTIDKNARDLNISDTQFNFYKTSRSIQSRYLYDLIEHETDRLKEYSKHLEFQQVVKSRYDHFLKNNPNVTKKLAAMERNRISKPVITRKKKNKMSISINLKQLRQNVIHDSRSNSITAIDNVDEPRYCWCNQPSFGEMIACDNEKCPKEWFHYQCVGLKKAPKGEWFCSDKCRKQRLRQKNKKRNE